MEPLASIDDYEWGEGITPEEQKAFLASLPPDPSPTIPEEGTPSTEELRASEAMSTPIWEDVDNGITNEQPLIKQMRRLRLFDDVPRKKSLIDRMEEMGLFR